MKKEKAFTLIELLVVIAIISLISSIVLVLLKEPRERARIAKVLPFAQSIHSLLGANAVGIWNFNGNLQDASGNNNHGTFFGEATIPFTDDTPNKALGQALSFDGVDDYIEVTSNASLKPAIITVEAWVKLTDPTLRRQLFLTKWYGYSCETDENHKPFFRIYNGGDSPKGNALVVGDWYHFVGVYDPSAGAEYQGNTLYINGERVGTTPNTNAITHSDNILTIGKYTGGLYWGGLIDEVRIYSQALTSAEIQKHYVQGLERHKFVQK